MIFFATFSILLVFQLKESMYEYDVISEVILFLKHVNIVFSFTLFDCVEFMHRKQKNFL
jgi:hypothetical protein